MRHTAFAFGQHSRKAYSTRTTITPSAGVTSEKWSLLRPLEAEFTTFAWVGLYTRSDRQSPCRRHHEGKACNSEFKACAPPLDRQTTKGTEKQLQSEESMSHATRGSTAAVIVSAGTALLLAEAAKAAPTQSKLCEAQERKASNKNAPGSLTDSTGSVAGAFSTCPSASLRAFLTHSACIAAFVRCNTSTLTMCNGYEDKTKMGFT